jgi:uncharacterized phage protein (TIGR02218 family)
MRQASDAAKAFFASRAAGFYADLFTLTLKGGSVLRWTSLDIDVTWGGNTWLAQSPNLERSALSIRNTAETPKLEIMLSAIDTDFVGGSNVKTAIWQGAFDGARMELDRLPMTFPGDTSLGPPITLYAGRIGEIELTAVGAKITVCGDVVIMTQYAPRNVFQSGCQHTFCDAGCTLLASNFTVAGAVGAGSSRSFIAWGGAGTIYRGGFITFISGANAGQIRSIRDADSSGLFLVYPLYVDPVAGDAFTAIRGCDKTLATCTGDFGNQLHYRGFPFVPDASYAA